MPSEYWLKWSLLVSIVSVLLLHQVLLLLLLHHRCILNGKCIALFSFLLVLVIPKIHRLIVLIVLVLCLILELHGALSIWHHNVIVIGVYVLSFWFWFLLLFQRCSWLLCLLELLWGHWRQALDRHKVEIRNLVWNWPWVAAHPLASKSRWQLWKVTFWCLGSIHYSMRLQYASTHFDQLSGVNLMPVTKVGVLLRSLFESVVAAKHWTSKGSLSRVDSNMIFKRWAALALSSTPLADVVSTCTTNNHLSDGVLLKTCVVSLILHVVHWHGSCHLQLRCFINKS